MNQKPNPIIKCPICSSMKHTLLHENREAVLYSCNHCGTNYQIRKTEINKPYDEDYFILNHQKAYGRSYIEDEDNIRAFSKRRLRIIRSLIPRGESLLDAGSALGLFCDEANKAGFQARGAEISGYARKFSGEHFGINTYDDFINISDRFDCVTLWFTLEHIEKPWEWIEKCREILNENGILGLSVPNGNGAFAGINRCKYVEARPVEHFFEPSLPGMKLLLKKYGFRIENIRFFGLHPDRIGLPDWKILRLLQKLLGLGDTFEIYARKIPSSDTD
jgi:SAM-dependent methyltransferase